MENHAKIWKSLLRSPPSWSRTSTETNRWRTVSVAESKIRPVAQISPVGSFVPLVNLAGVGTPDPPWAGAFAPALLSARQK